MILSFLSFSHFSFTSLSALSLFIFLSLFHSSICLSIISFFSNSISCISFLALSLAFFILISINSTSFSFSFIRYLDLILSLITLSSSIVFLYLSLSTVLLFPTLDSLSVTSLVTNKTLFTPELLWIKFVFNLGTFTVLCVWIVVILFFWMIFCSPFFTVFFKSFVSSLELFIVSIFLLGSIYIFFSSFV